MNEIKAIVFDMDGVLLDSESISDITWDKAAEDFNITMTAEILNSCRGSNKTDIINKLLEIYGKSFNAEAFLDKTGDYFSQIEMEKGIPLLPYVKESLEYLKSKYIIALASSTKGPTVARQLKNAGIIDFFKTRTTGEMVTHSKPNPEIYLMACKSINIKPENCIAVEDSFNGIKSAHNAGLKTIMIPDKVQPTEEIKKLCWKVCKSLKELTELL